MEGLISEKERVKGFWVYSRTGLESLNNLLNVNSMYIILILPTSYIVDRQIYMNHQ